MKQQKITKLTIPIIMTHTPTCHNHIHSLLYSMLTTSLTKQSTKPNEYEIAMTDASSRKLSPKNAIIPIKYSMHKQITRTIRKQSTKNSKESLRMSSTESAKYRPHLTVTPRYSNVPQPISALSAHPPKIQIESAQQMKTKITTTK